MEQLFLPNFLQNFRDLKKAGNFPFGVFSAFKKIIFSKNQTKKK
jgi:hypothetical protein